jgi:hypothetical protein
MSCFNFIINVAFSFIIDVALNVVIYFFIHVFINGHIKVYTFLKRLSPLHYRYDAMCFQGVFLQPQIGPQF